MTETDKIVWKDVLMTDEWVSPTHMTEYGAVKIIKHQVRGGSILILEMNQNIDIITLPVAIAEVLAVLHQIESCVNKQKYRFGMKQSLHCLNKIVDPHNSFESYIGYTNVIPKTDEMKYSSANYTMIMCRVIGIPKNSEDDNLNEEENSDGYSVTDEISRTSGSEET